MMKKIVIGLSVAFLLMGCSYINEKENHKEDFELNQEAGIELSPDENPQFNHDPAENGENIVDSGLNHEEIMAGNFASFAGEYVNSEGTIMLLDEADIERRLLDVMCIEDIFKIMQQNIKRQEMDLVMELMFTVSEWKYPILKD